MIYIYINNSVYLMKSQSFNNDALWSYICEYIAAYSSNNYLSPGISNDVTAVESLWSSLTMGYK